MKEKHFIITLAENFTVSKSRGVLNRNSNSTQWIDVELDDWLLNEGEGLYIELLHYDDDTELTTRVGPLYFVYNRQLDRYITLAPPELLNLAGEWKYSLELRRYEDVEADKTVTTVVTITDKKGDTVSQTTIVKNHADCVAVVEDGEAEPSEKTYNSITSAVYSLAVTDSIISATNGDCSIKESELLTAAEIFNKSLDEANDANDSAHAALGAAEAALSAAEAAKIASENAQLSAETAKDAADAAADKAEQKADDAANEAISAMNSAQAADSALVAAQAAADKAEQHETSANVALNQATNEAQAAQVSAQDAENWANKAAELFATHSIKISTEYTTVEDLPAEGNSQTIYFIPNGGEDENSFDEYVWVESKGSYEKIGSTEVDLSGYVSKAGSEMTGALKTPKINVDKIARNEKDFIYVEPPTTFHSGVTFEKTIKADKEITTPKISNDGDDPILISEAQFRSTATFDGTVKFNKIVNFEDTVNISTLSTKNEKIILKASVDGDSGEHDITNIDKIGAKCVDLGQPHGLTDLRIYADTLNEYEHSGDGENSHLVIRADSGVTITGSEADNGIKVNVLGELSENGERVYSANNPPPTDTTRAPVTALTDGSVTKLGITTKGSTTTPIYLNNGEPTACRDIPEITLNGNINSSPSFWAPTAPGQSGQVLCTSIYDNDGADEEFIEWTYLRSYLRAIPLYDTTSVTTGQKSLSKNMYNYDYLLFVTRSNDSNNQGGTALIPTSLFISDFNSAAHSLGIQDGSHYLVVYRVDNWTIYVRSMGGVKDFIIYGVNIDTYA